MSTEKNPLRYHEWIPTAEAEQYSPEHHHFEWNEDYTMCKVSPLLWWDEDSYICYQSGCREDDTALSEHHQAEQCSCNSMYCKICTAPGSVCEMCGCDYENPEEKCSGPRAYTANINDDSDDLPF